MSEFVVTKAEREQSPITAAIIGQSGSGKTYSALLFARGLVGKDGKIVIIDTEGKRALIYADDEDIGSFHHIDFGVPYSSDRYKSAIMAAVMSDADAVIIDSVSHSHEGEGGMIDFADKEEQRIKGPSRFIAKWIKPKISHGRFVRYAVGCPAHIIFCIREKCISDTSDEAKNKKPEDKVIYVPVCEKNFIFEMTLAVRLEPDTHKATFIKVPKPFEKHIENGAVLTVEHGRKLLETANTGKALDKELEKQLSICKDVAALGLTALQDHWGTLSKDIKTKLKTDLDTKLKPIAVQADEDSRLLEGCENDK